MIRLLILFAFIAGAMLLGPVIVNNPGYVKVVVAGVVLESTVLGLVIVALCFIFLCWLAAALFRKLLRLKHVSFNFLRWRRQRQAQQAFELGLQAYAKQQWHLASQHLEKACNDSFMLNEKRLMAAYATFYSGNVAGANNVVDKLPQEQSSTLFLQADLLLQQGRADEACHLLSAHVTSDVQDKGLGQLYLYALQQAKRWQELLALVPAVIKHKWFESDKWQAQRFSIYPAAISQLSQQDSFDEKADYWRNLPSKERRSTAANLGKAWALAQNNQQEEAEKLLLSHLQLSELPLMLPHLKQIPLGHAVLKLRKKTQQWLHDNPSNPYLYVLLAYLSEQEGEKDQAALAMQKAKQYDPTISF